MSRCAGESAGFFIAWLKSPLRVAAISPSSRTLASLMTADISHETGPVIELGPGTGVFTQALIERGVRQQDLVLIESGVDFTVSLQRRFPLARTMTLDAARLWAIPVFDGRLAGAVISGLPLLSMPLRKIVAILTSAFRKLRPDGAFYQFTYGPRCPVPSRVLERLGLEAERIGGTLANLPPASVYRLRRRDRADAVNGSRLEPEHR